MEVLEKHTQQFKLEPVTPSCHACLFIQGTQQKMLLASLPLAQLDLASLLIRLGFESVCDPQLGVLAVMIVSGIANADCQCADVSVFFWTMGGVDEELFSHCRGRNIALTLSAAVAIALLFALVAIALQLL